MLLLLRDCKVGMRDLGSIVGSKPGTKFGARADQEPQYIKLRTLTQWVRLEDLASASP